MLGDYEIGEVKKWWGKMIGSFMLKIILGLYKCMRREEYNVQHILEECFFDRFRTSLDVRHSILRL